jgi:tripartite-type tricarboxylate transporter receptor subunit TctC
MKRRHLLQASALALSLASAVATAQSDWPTKPVRIVHGFTAGGPVDNLARLVAAQFPDTFGQQAIVEGKPGAGGSIGANYVAKAEPDGYTLFLMASGHSAAPGMYKSLPFDAINDFTMVSMVARSPFAIIAAPNFPASSMQELMARAKAQPGKIDYGSGGTGSGMHLAAVLFQARTGVQFTHVPYKGGSAPALAVMSGEVPIIFTSLAGMSGHIESGKVKALAVTSRSRFGAFPNVPTVGAARFRRQRLVCAGRPEEPAAGHRRETQHDDAGHAAAARHPGHAQGHGRRALAHQRRRSAGLPRHRREPLDQGGPRRRHPAAELIRPFATRPAPARTAPTASPPAAPASAG